MALYVLGQACVGAGGSFAAIFSILTIGNAVGSELGPSSLWKVPVYASSLCVVAGFVGHRLLVGVGKSLETQIVQARDKADEAVGIAERATAKIEDVSKRSQMNVDVVIARDLNLEFEKDPNSVTRGDQRARGENLLAKLSAHAVMFPTERVLNIVLANLKLYLTSTQDAIAQLSTFLNSRRDAHLSEGEDDAAAWFNLACFNTKLSTEQGEDIASGHYGEQALKAVDNCFRIALSNGVEGLKLQVSKAEQDPDLSVLRRTERYRNLIQQLSTN